MKSSRKLLGRSGFISKTESRHQPICLRELFNQGYSRCHGLFAGAVMTHLHRARLTLREILGKDYVEDAFQEGMNNKWLVREKTSCTNFSGQLNEDESRDIRKHSNAALLSGGFWNSREMERSQETLNKLRYLKTILESYRKKSTADRWMRKYKLIAPRKDQTASSELSGSQ